MSYLRGLAALWLTLLLGACALGPLAPVDEAPEGTSAPAPEPAAEAPAPAAETPVRKSPNDPRRYRYLTLDNGMQVLLVSDPRTDQAAASLVVFRGSHHEPAEYPGLAHFLEHMLFIGTEKYPEVDAYQAFVGRHGGSSNAYTAGDHTNYFFDVRPGHFREAMDRFSQFFISPLLDADYVEREKNAVHSEYQLQLKADNWRGSAVMSELMNPAHPQSRFSIGSLETLGPGVREALQAFFDTHYSADQMALVALSREPLDTLEQWVVPMFEQVQNRELGPAPVTAPLFLDSDLPAVLRYRTIKDGYRVAYNFPVPAVERFYRQKPADYVANLLGHEGQGSLYQHLQTQGWIESLAAGAGSFDEANSLLVVDIELTSDGYRNLDHVTQALFDYVALLQATPPEAWRYRELARMAELGFRFQERASAGRFVYEIAPRFMDYPPEHVLAAPYLMSDFDPGLIATYLNALTPENLVMEVTGPDVPTDRQERWFEVPYAVEPGPPPRSGVATAGLALPPPNPYLPERLEVLDDEPELPRLAVARPGLTLWSDRDTEFGTPRANLYLSLGIPGGIATPEDLALATLYARLVEDTLNEAVYPAYLAGLGYRLSVDGYGFEVALSGYSDKQLTLLGTVLDGLTGADIDPERFRLLREDLMRDWRNFHQERPYTQAYSALSYLLLSSRWPPQMLVEALGDVTPERLDAWRDERLEKFHALGLMHGNVPVEGAWALASELQERLTLGAFPRQAPRVVELDNGGRYPIDVDHQDAAMVVYLQDPAPGVETRARSALAASVLRQAYFTSLRTEQQLGYVVSVAQPTLRDRGGLAFIVQSPVASAAALERATQAFLAAQLEAIAAMPEPVFESYKQGLVATLTERDKNLAERGRRLWADLDLGVTSFDLNQQLAAAVTALSRDDLLRFLTGTAARFDSDRLLVYSTGRFDEAPAGGAVLQDLWELKGAG